MTDLYKFNKVFGWTRWRPLYENLYNILIGVVNFERSALKCGVIESLFVQVTPRYFKFLL